MNHKELIITNVKHHLEQLKLDPFKAGICANKAHEYYLKSIGNSKDPYKEICDYAGKLASGMDAKFKYKSPVVKTGKRVKRPQDIFEGF